MAGLLDWFDDPGTRQDFAQGLLAAAGPLLQGRQYSLDPSVMGYSPWGAAAEQFGRGMDRSMDRRLKRSAFDMQAEQQRRAFAKDDRQQAAQQRLVGLLQTQEGANAHGLLTNPQFLSAMAEAGGAAAIPGLLASGIKDRPKLSTVNTAEGVYAFDPETGQRGERLGSPTERPQAGSNLAKLMAEREAFPPGSPQRAAYDAAINKETQGEPKSPFGGGVEGSALGIINSLAPKIASGTATPDEHRLYSLAHSAATMPRILTMPDGSQALATPTLPQGIPAPPSIQQPAPGPATGGQPAPVPAPQGGGLSVTRTGEAKPMAFDDATKIASLRQAKADIEGAESAIMKDGKPDRGIITSGSRIPLGITDIQGIPFTKGREVRQQIRRSVEVLLRLRTGAAAQASEVDNYTNMYAPSPGDSDETIRQKFTALRGLYDEILQMVTPGRPQVPPAPSPPPGPDAKPTDRIRWKIENGALIQE